MLLLQFVVTFPVNAAAAMLRLLLLLHAAVDALYWC